MRLVVVGIIGLVGVTLITLATVFFFLSESQIQVERAKTSRMKEKAKSFLVDELEAKKFSEDHTTTALPSQYLFSRLISYKITSFETEREKEGGPSSYVANITVQLELQGNREEGLFGGGPTVTRFFEVRIFDATGGTREPFWVARVIRGD